jgi:putative iron-regulated protein
MMMQRLSLAAGAGLAAIVVQSPAQGADSGNGAAVVATYADIAQAMYADSLAEAERLRAAIAALVEAPGEDTLQAARDAWLAARVPYQQTEVYRFGNPIVDDWEAK